MLMGNVRSMYETRITALREHPRRKGRYVVEVAGQAIGAISVELIAELGLRVGDDVSPELRERIETGARRVACFDRAMDALARRARSRADLGRWLREREFAAPDIEAALDRLVALGLLDDHAFARGFARTRLAAGRGFGPRRVAAELSRRGVARGVVDAVLAELADDAGAPDERTAARAVAERRAKSLRGLAPEEARRRLVAFLVRRGFGQGTAFEAARLTLAGSRLTD